jgi:glycosyltransferase involved in cell wall biosynthesis
MRTPISAADVITAQEPDWRSVPRSLRFLLAVNIPFPEGRGNTRRIMSISRELVKQGHRVTILMPFSRVPQASVRVVDGVRAEWSFVPSPRHSVTNARKRVKLRVQFISRCKWLKALWRKSKRRQYDWLYLYQPGIDGLLAAGIARHFGLRVCSEFVDLLSPNEYRGLTWRLIYLFQVLADRKTPALSDRILTISSRLQETYHRRNPGAPILIFPTLVDTARFGAGDRRRFRRNPMLGDRPVVSFIGSYARPQGLRLLIEAMAGVVRQEPGALLVLAGGAVGKDVDDADGLIRKHGIGTNALNLGLVPESDVVDLLAASDILVAPKLDEPVNHAGLSTKIAEYLASGRAVIASNVGDVGRYLTHEKDALLLPPGDREALEEGLLRLLRDASLRERLGLAGKRAALRHFDITANVAGLVRFLVR